jgi:hypothetical protein
MEKYKLYLFMRGVDWLFVFPLVVFIPLGCLSFMAAAIFILIKEHNLRESFGMAIGSLICIVIWKHYWDIYVLFPHEIFVDNEKEYIYLRRIIGKLSAIPIKEIQGVKTHFWFLLIYFPAFMGYKKVIVAESTLPEGFFIMSPFFKKREELLGRILKHRKRRDTEEGTGEKTE